MKRVLIYIGEFTYMKDDFYTMGGGHFWEDVFFYQKWRIQRNYITKKCRLLDNWDIRRHEGSFEDCRKAFVKYIEAYEISRQKGHMVIMIHSLGQSKNVFKPLWRRALKEGFMAAAVNYPSSQKHLDAHVKQFHFFLDHLEDVDTVSFVTLGAGNAILQKLFTDDAEWQKKLQIGRSVEVSPYIYGSKLLKTLSSNHLTGFIIGPMGEDLYPETMNDIPPLTRIENGIILSNKSFIERTLEVLTGSSMPNVFNDEIKEYTKATDIIEINDHHFNIFNNEHVCNAVMSFLKDGKF